jgi:hypothetical protein
MAMTDHLRVDSNSGLARRKRLPELMKLYGKGTFADCGDADWQRLKEGALIGIALWSPNSNRAGIPASIVYID